MPAKPRNYEVTCEQVRSLFTYDPETGYFYARTPSRGHSVGRRAGGASKVGPNMYRVIYIGGKARKEHIMAFLYMEGRYPEHYIDHIDGNGENNAWSNLREATCTQNLWNRTVTLGASGLKGAYPHTGKYVAKIRCNGKNYYLGRFNTAEEAHAAYCIAAKSLFGEFANPGKPRSAIPIEQCMRNKTG